MIGPKYNELYISIHTLRVEGDQNVTFISYDIDTFLSTPSVWRVTDLVNFHSFSPNLIISIHTLRVEGDGGGHGLLM